MVTKVIRALGVTENVGEISKAKEFFNTPTSIIEESAVPNIGIPSNTLFTPVNLAPAS